MASFAESFAAECFPLWAINQCRRWRWPIMHLWYLFGKGSIPRGSIHCGVISFHRKCHFWMPKFGHFGRFQAKVPMFGHSKMALSMEWNNRYNFYTPQIPQKCCNWLLNWAFCIIQWNFGQFPLFGFFGRFFCRFYQKQPNKSPKWKSAKISLNGVIRSFQKPIPTFFGNFGSV